MTEAEIDRLRQAIAAHPPGPFHLSDVFGPLWPRLDIGARVRAGRDFLQAVRRGALPGVIDSGRKQAGGRIYLRNMD